MNLSFIGLLILMFFVSCSSKTKYYELKDYAEARSFHYIETMFGVDQLRKVFSDPKSWPTFYSTSYNKDFLLGEKLKIEEVLIKIEQINQRNPFDLAYTLDGRSYREIYGNWEVPFKMERFDEIFTPSGYDKSIKLEINNIKIQANLLLKGENGNFRKESVNFVFDIFCESGSSKKCIMTEEVLNSPSSYLKEFLSKKVSSVDARIQQIEDQVSLKDPLVNYRSDLNLISKLQRRLIWVGMKKEMLDIYKLNLMKGDFSCGLINKRCNSGYRNIIIKDDEVKKFTFFMRDRMM